MIVVSSYQSVIPESSISPFTRALKYLLGYLPSVSFFGSVASNMPAIRSFSSLMFPRSASAGSFVSTNRIFATSKEAKLTLTSISFAPTSTAVAIVPIRDSFSVLIVRSFPMSDLTSRTLSRPERSTPLYVIDVSVTLSLLSEYC